jgi:hypothetical protein
MFLRVFVCGCNRALVGLAEMSLALLDTELTGPQRASGRSEREC